MTGVLTAARKRSPITVDANWGVDDGPAPVSSIAGTLTVPPGNPGVIRFVVNSSTGGTQAYIKNGAPSAFVDGTTASVANGDTLALTYSALIGNSASYSVYDNTTNTIIGTWAASIS